MNKEVWSDEISDMRAAIDGVNDSLLNYAFDHDDPNQVNRAMAKLKKSYKKMKALTSGFKEKQSFCLEDFYGMSDELIVEVANIYYKYTHRNVTYYGDKPSRECVVDGAKRCIEDYIRKELSVSDIELVRKLIAKNEHQTKKNDKDNCVPF